MKKYDVTALGECLIDFTPAGVSPAGMLLFERNPGGAPGNLLVSAARLGRKTAFIGKVGDDSHGRFLCKTLEEQGVDVRGLKLTDEAFTTLAFVELAEAGERSFSFARKPGADTLLRMDEVDAKLLENSAIFHVGSLSMTDEPVRSTTLAAIEKAKAAGALISYDPNYRPLLWPSEEEACRRIRELHPYMDVIKIADNECEIATGHEDMHAAAAYLLEQGITCVVVTLGGQGAHIFTREGDRAVPSFRPEAVVDTTGAGDAFWGGFLTKLSESGKNPRDLTLEQLHEMAVFACAVASLCVERRGGMPAMPDRASAEARCAGDC